MNRESRITERIAVSQHNHAVAEIGRIEQEVKHCRYLLLTKLMSSDDVKAIMDRAKRIFDEVGKIMGLCQEELSGIGLAASQSRFDGIANRISGPTLQEIQSHIKGRYRMEPDNNPDDGSLMYSTRAHGNVGDETPGQEDMRYMQRVKKELHEKYGNDIVVTIDTIDEWTNLYVELK